MAPCEMGIKDAYLLTIRIIFVYLLSSSLAVCICCLKNKNKHKALSYTRVDSYTQNIQFFNLAC